jgi:hypothetical protein
MSRWEYGAPEVGVLVGINLAQSPCICGFHALGWGRWGLYNNYVNRELAFREWTAAEREMPGNILKCA